MATEPLRDEELESLAFGLRDLSRREDGEDPQELVAVAERIARERFESILLDPFLVDEARVVLHIARHDGLTRLGDDADLERAERNTTPRTGE